MLLGGGGIINTTLSSWVPTQPNGAAAWGFNRCVFNSDFVRDGLSRIDVNNTGTNGFQWYVSNNWIGGFGGDAATPANNFSIGANGLILPAAPNNDNLQMESMFAVNSSSFYGEVFNAGVGFSVEFNVAIDKSQITGGVRHTSLWMVPEEAALLGTVPWDEDDALEILDTGGVMLNNMHRWNTGGLQSSLIDASQGFGALGDTNLHRIVRNVIPASINGGFGKREIWYDDVHKTACDVTYSASGSCAQSDNNAVGMYSEADTMHYFINVAGPLTGLKSVNVFMR
jgi:hypothetical protein